MEQTLLDVFLEW